MSKTTFYGPDSLDSPSMQEKWEPEPVKLIWDLRIEERQQAAYIIHAVHLKKR